MRFRICRIPAAFILLSSMLSPSSAGAEVLPQPAAIAAPAERPALDRLVALVVNRSTVGDPLGELDAILGSLDRPTPLRGLVQFFRASHLFGRQLPAPGAAREAIEESIRLLPSYSGPLFLAANIEAYDDRSAQATDYLLRAAEIDPQVALTFSDYDLDNLVTRLQQGRDDRRRQRLAERLFEIGWRGDNLSLRSSMARDLILARHGRGDIAGARTLIRHLAVPDHSYGLLSNLEFEALWPDIEAWAGPRQSLQWRLYLSETRARWRVSGDAELAVRYIRALNAAGHSGTIIREMLPLFQRRLDPRADYHLLWVATYVADALARNGRWAEVDTMFGRALETWPLGSEANALNLAANRARYRLAGDDAEAGLAGLDSAIADAARWGGDVSAGALATMHANRACALHRLGRQQDALPSVAITLANAPPVSAAEMLLCLGRFDSARAALIEGLSTDAFRDDVVAFAQPDDRPAFQSDYGRLLRARQDAIRADPVLLAEIRRYARMLPYSSRAGAPTEEAAPAAPPAR